jgi:hypothetical protein
MALQLGHFSAGMSHKAQRRRAFRTAFRPAGSTDAPCAHHFFLSRGATPFRLHALGANAERSAEKDSEAPSGIAPTQH